MRSRWFHTPLLHSAQGPKKRVSWLELFYDLIFVAAFIQLGNGLAEHLDAQGTLGFVWAFGPMWLAWTGLSLYVNRYDVDDFIHRILVIVQMFSVGAMAIYAPAMVAGDVMAFSLAFAAAQAIVALLYFRILLQCADGRAYSRYWGMVFAAGALIWLVAAFAPTPLTYTVQAVGVVVVLIAPFSRQSRALREEYPWDQDHLSERYGLLTLIVLGESFVKVLSSLNGTDGGLGVLGQATITLLVTICLWWIYFDDVAGSRLRKVRLGTMLWLFAHLPLQLALIAVGVGVKKAVLFDLSAVPPAGYRWLLCGSLSLALFSVALIDSVTERRQANLSDKTRVSMRGFSALLILLLAPAGGGMDGDLFLSLVALVCAAQVVFDLMMAPFEAISEEALHELPTTADMARQAREEGSAPRPLNERFLDAVRAGAPSELRSDLYHFFIDGPWTRLFVALGFLYLVSNLAFAALYFMEPGSIANARPESFGDAFFFSIQTMSTIGYGALSPSSLYGNAIVTLEAAFGLAGVALATGVMFAKASRPRSSVLFSDKVTISRRNGVPTLIFRVGNVRGSEIVDAQISVSVLKEEITPEGHHLRRLFDLPLERSRTPVFYLTWTVMHPIDEASPLFGADLDHPEQCVLALIALLSAHDGSYGQTTYARHLYTPSDIRPWHRFVDVLSQLPDGRALINYDVFHDVVPDPPAGGSA